jgi:hypothetical protein
LTAMEYLCYKRSLICSTCRKHFQVLSSCMMYHRVFSYINTTVSLEEQELPTLPEDLSSPPVFITVRVTWSLVLYLCCVDRCSSFCTFSFDHFAVCSFSIYGFWLPLWFLQTLLTMTINDHTRSKIITVRCSV